MGRSGKKKSGKGASTAPAIVKDKKDEPEPQLAPVIEKPLEESKVQTFKEKIEKDQKPAPTMQNFSGFGSSNTFKNDGNKNSFGNSFGTVSNTGVANLPLNPKLDFSGGFQNQSTKADSKLVGVKLPSVSQSQLGSLSSFSGFGA